MNHYGKFIDILFGPIGNDLFFLFDGAGCYFFGGGCFSPCDLNGTG